MRCPTGAQLLNNTMPQLEFRSVVIPNVFATKYTTNWPGNPACGRDYILRFSRPYKFFMVVSAFQEIDFRLWIHFAPINKISIATNVINPDGTENWIPISDSTNNKGPMGKFIRLRVPVDTLFLDFDHPSGSGQGKIFTIMGSNDIKRIDTNCNIF